MGPFRFLVESHEGGLRLDKFLAARVPSQSRSAIQRHIQEGAVLVEGSPAKPSRVLRPGEEVVYEPPEPRPSTLEPQDIPIAVVYEDAHLVVVDKPAGLVVHPAAGHPDGTLVNALLSRCPDLKGVGDEQRPGIVHRLDKDTSGVMVVAKTDAAHRGLTAAFSRHAVVRMYLALVRGRPPDSGTWETPYGRHPVDRKRFTSRTGSRRAKTRYRVLAEGAEASLVAARLETGRTHQVRVHFAEAGFPLLGDPVYGGRVRDRRLAEVAGRLGRQALHAAVLGFRHPVSGDPLCFVRPPPGDFLEALGALRISYPPSGWPPEDLEGRVAGLPWPLPAGPREDEEP